MDHAKAGHAQTYIDILNTRISDMLTGDRDSWAAIPRGHFGRNQFSDFSTPPHGFFEPPFNGPLLVESSFSRKEKSTVSDLRPIGSGRIEIFRPCRGSSAVSRKTEMHGLNRWSEESCLAPCAYYGRIESSRPRDDPVGCARRGYPSAGPTVPKIDRRSGQPRHGRTRSTVSLRRGIAENIAKQTFSKLRKPPVPDEPTGAHVSVAGQYGAIPPCGLAIA